MPQIENLTPTSELEAVNTLLRSIGEAPLTALSSGNADEDLALETLRAVVRETCTTRWRFNSEYNYDITTSGDDSNGWPVFEPPASMASFMVARSAAQEGIDVIRRESRDGSPVTAGTDILADRINATDGIEALDAGGSETLTIHIAWLVDWEHLPPSARSYIVVAAARRFQQTVIGNNEQAAFGFTQEDEKTAWAHFQADQQENVPVTPLTSTAPDELSAINQMLFAGGKDPVIDLTAIDDRFQEHARSIFRDANREVQSEGWRFNFEVTYELTPDDTYAWTDSSGEVTTLNIWERPTGLLWFDLSAVADQHAESAQLRAPVRYVGSNDVFYDRYRNRDGYDSDTFEYLYIDVCWLRDFDEIPETARQYIIMLATQRFLQTLPEKRLGELPWTDRDLRMARNTLVKQEGLRKPRNIFNSDAHWDFLGRRPGGSPYTTFKSTRR